MSRNFTGRRIHNQFPDGQTFKYTPYFCNICQRFVVVKVTFQSINERDKTMFVSRESIEDGRDIHVPRCLEIDENALSSTPEEVLTRINEICGQYVNIHPAIG